MAATTFNVPDSYTHYPKLITPNDELILGDARLKWYDIHRAGSKIGDDVQKKARDFLRSDSELEIDGDLGFVILHLCGDSFFFLIVCTWRNGNELWETTYAKDGDTPFALFPKGRHKPVFCVWELGAVIHEQRTWTKYLYSERDDAARRAWMADRFRGEV